MYCKSCLNLIVSVTSDGKSYRSFLTFFFPKFLNGREIVSFFIKIYTLNSAKAASIQIAHFDSHCKPTIAVVPA